MAIKKDGTVIIDTRVDTKGFNKGVGNMQKSVSGLIGSISKIGAAVGLAFGVKALVDFGKESINLASDLEEVQNVVNTVFRDMSNEINEFAKNAITQFGLSELSAKKYASTMGAMLKSMGFDTQDALEISKTLTGLTGDIASFYNLTSEEAFAKIRSGISGETEPLKQLGINLSVANLEAYALAEGITKSYNAMTEQEKALLRYNYLLKTTADAQGDFARTSDSWSNQIKLLKEQFNSLKAILGKSFINIFKPIISSLNEVMKSLIAFAETFSNALGKIFGWKYEVSAGVSTDLENGEDAANGISGGMDDAAKSAKDLKNSLSALDKLNVINADTASNGSGVAIGGGNVSPGKWVEQKSIFEEFKSEIDSLYELGEYIRDALINAMESIDWDSVYEKARGFGKGLAEFLNGLLAYDGEGRTLFGTIGKTLANTLNAVVYSALEFAKEFDFYQFGVNLADGIDEFLRNFDFYAFGESLSYFASGLLDTLTGFLEKAMDDKTFAIFGEKIVEFICGIDWGNLVWDFANFFEALSNALVQFPADFGSSVLNAIIDEIFGENANIEIDPLILQKSFEKALRNIKVIDASFIFVDMKKRIEEARNIFSPIGEALSHAKDDWKTILRNFIKDDLEPLFGADTWASIVNSIKENPLRAFLEMRESWKEDISKWWKEDVLPYFDGGTWSLLTGVMASALNGSLYDMIKEWNKDIKKWWDEDVLPWFEEKNWTFDGIKEGLSQAFKNAIESVKTVWNNFADWLNSALTINLDPIEILGKKVYEGGTFKLASIPYLASGAVIPPNAPFAAILGDQRHGNNIEAPESLIRQIMREELAQIGVNVTFEVEGDPNGIFKVTQNKAREYTRRTGAPAF